MGLLGSLNQKHTGALCSVHQINCLESMLLKEDHLYHEMHQDTNSPESDGAE